MYVAQDRLYLTVDGRVVGHGDPDAHTLLVPKGGRLSMQDAHRYGLDRAAPAPVETEAVFGPPANKARTSAARKRG